MTWVRIDDQFPKHPKIARCGPIGQALFVSGLCYCAQYLTDGFIPSGVAAALIDATDDDLVETFDIRRVIQRLVDSGMWEKVRGGYQVHDYLEYQPSKETVQARRDEARNRMRSHRSREVRANNDRTSSEVHARPVTPVSPNPDNPQPEPSPGPNAGAREAVAVDRDEWRDAVSEGVYRKPYERLMPSERGEVDDAADDLEGSGVEPPAIVAACDYWRRDEKYRELPLRPGGLIRNWSVLEQRMSQNGATTSAPHQRDPLAREREYADEKQRLLAALDHGDDAGRVAARAAPDAPGPNGVSRLSQPARGP